MLNKNDNNLKFVNTNDFVYLYCTILLSHYNPWTDSTGNGSANYNYNQYEIKTNFLWLLHSRLSIILYKSLMFNSVFSFMYSVNNWFILTVWMKHFTRELHFRWTQWIIWWENEFCWKHTSFKTGSIRASIKKNLFYLKYNMKIKP